MRKLKVHFKISSIANPSIAARCPNGDLPMIVGFIVVRRRPAGAPGSHHWAAYRSSSGHRPKILSSAERIGRSPNSRPAVAGRRPLHDFYDMVQGRENPAMICRCQKVGIGEKSGGHRRIYNPCDVPLRQHIKLITFYKSLPITLMEVN